MKNKRFALFLFLISYLISSMAQEVPEIINFTHQNILNKQIWSITQAKDGRMYFGTSNGMIFFDGTNWQNFEPSQQDVIRTVAADNEGRIYKGNYGEFGYWKRDELDQLQYFSLSEKINIETKEEIWHIQFSGELIYFQSFSTIYKYDKEKVEKIDPPGNIMFLQSVREQLLFQQIGGGIYEMSPSNSFQLLPETQFFSDKKVVFILPFEEEGLLIGTEHRGIFVWNNNKLTSWDTQWQNAFQVNQLNKGIKLSNGDFVFGTILNGAYILDKNGKIKIHLNKQKGLPDNTVLSLSEDRSGNLWLGLDKGTGMVDLNNSLMFFKDVEGDIGAVYSAALFQDHLYLGTNHGVFFRAENKNKKESEENEFQFVAGTQGQVWELQEFGNQLLCGHNDGTFAISKNNIRKISSNNGGWVTKVFPEDENLLLQGTYSGLVVFKKNKKEEWELSHRVNGFLEPVKEMVIDSSGGIWLAHPIEGLHRVVLDASKTEISFIQKFSKEDGLPSDKMVSLIFSEEKVFARAGKKWYRYDTKANRFVSSGTFKNYPLEKIKGKISLGENDTWFELLPRQVNYFFKNKTGTLPLSLRAGYENTIHLTDGQYLFCLDNGYALLNSGNIKQDSPRNFPPIIINRIEIVQEDSISMISLTTNNLELDNHQNRLRFHFYQPCFSSPPPFRYRLLGVENNWSTWSEKSEKEYFNLSTGKYTFQIESKFGNQSSEVNFEILPHWTQSWWAYLLYFLGFITLLGFLQSLQKRKFEADKRKMQKDQERLLLEQQMQADNEKLHIDIVNKSKQLANSTMNLVQKNEILLQIKNELLQLKKKSDVQIPGKDYQQLLHIIDLHLTSEQDWELFEKNFNQVHELFLKKLKIEFPELTPGDLQLSAYLKMNLSSKEIAPLLHISIRGIENKRYRLRKKLGLSKDGNLTEFLMNY